MENDSRQEMREKWREDRRKFRDEMRSRYQGRFGRGHIWTGVLLVIIGIAALLKAMLFNIPEWLYTWQMLLIVIGLFIGVRHGFRGAAWFILMLIGGVFLLDEFFPDLMMRRFLWPGALILAGLFFILRPRRKYCRYGENEPSPDGSTSENPNTTPGEVTASSTTSFANDATQIHPEDVIDATSIFGGTKRNVLSKNFRGGDIVNIMGGSEIDLTQADIHGTVSLELTQIFGGTKLIVPSNWQVKTKMAAIFGGVEDKRSANTMLDSNKILLLEGTSIFGGIDIRSY